MKKRKVRALAVLLASGVALSLASCGTPTPSTTPSSGADTSVTAPSESTSTPSESTSTPSESTSTPSESTSTPTESTSTPTESTSVPIESTSVPSESTSIPTESTTETPSESTSTPTESTTVPSESTSTPTESTTETPSESAPGTSTDTPAVEKKVEMNGTVYNTVTEAFAAIPTDSTETYTITLNKGTYQEVGLSYKGSATIRIVGNTDAKYGSDVVIIGRGSNMSSMRGRELIEIQGSASIILENISLVSDYTRKETTKDVQAEVLGTDTTGFTVAYNCSFKSHQDTLRTTGKAWFYGCYVEGDTDFIWMESSGTVALYENCEIVSVYDADAKTHSSYVAAPRMGITSKVGKGLVFYNSVVKESDEAKENGQATYLARSPWQSGYYNQVAYINTTCTDVEVKENTDKKSKNAPWYGDMIQTDYLQTIIGWKMDTATASSLGLSGKDYVLTDEVTAVEYNGRKAILNRIYNTGKQKYERDALNNWDIDALIAKYNYKVDADASKDLLDGEVAVDPTVYKFDGSVDNSNLCNGFAVQTGKPHYVGNDGATITIPVSGKCYVEVYGYYAGTAEVKADTQGSSVFFFNNGTTNTEVEGIYIVNDANSKEVVITAKATTYITKILVTPDESIGEAKPVTSIDITASSKLQTVGVALKLSAIVNKDATNKSIVWSSSDTSVADIDRYSGKVTFKKEGTVDFIATALDGSGITQTFTCNPKEPTWTAAEWYTTDSNVVEEKGADGIENFATNNSAYKSLGSTYTFTNLAGETITTSNGLKLNSVGMLSIATTKKATLTITTCAAGKAFATPVVTDGTTTVKPASEEKAADGKTITYVYIIPGAGLWEISRGDTATENNPILYAKCEYKEPVISSSTGITFKGSYYTAANTGVNDIYNLTDVVDANGTTVELNDMKLTNCVSNGSKDNWLKFLASSKATIEFKVDKPCKVLVGYYSKLQTVKINGTIVAGNKDSIATSGDIVEYVISEAGIVVIEATADDYLGFVGVVFEAAADPEPEAPAYVSSLVYDFSRLENQPAQYEKIESTNEITFEGCINHDGHYIALKENNAIKIKLAKGATLTVSMPFSSGVTLNGEAVTLVENNLVYTATENIEVVISGDSGNAYIETITVVSE